MLVWHRPARDTAARQVLLLLRASSECPTNGRAAERFRNELGILIPWSVVRVLHRRPDVS